MSKPSAANATFKVSVKIFWISMYLTKSLWILLVLSWLVKLVGESFSDYCGGKFHGGFGRSSKQSQTFQTSLHKMFHLCRSVARPTHWFCLVFNISSDKCSLHYNIDPQQQLKARIVTPTSPLCANAIFSLQFPPSPLSSHKGRDRSGIQWIQFILQTVQIISLP